MNCPRCENEARRANRQWQCTACRYAFKSRGPQAIDAPPAAAPARVTLAVPRRRQPAADQSMAPEPDRIRLGDIWIDPLCRRHVAKPCIVDHLVVMEAMDHELVPVAMDARCPYPWRRLEWGGRP